MSKEKSNKAAPPLEEPPVPSVPNRAWTEMRQEAPDPLGKTPEEAKHHAPKKGKSADR